MLTKRTPIFTKVYSVHGIHAATVATCAGGVHHVKLSSVTHVADCLLGSHANHHLASLALSVPATANLQCTVGLACFTSPWSQDCKKSTILLLLLDPDVKPRLSRLALFADGLKAETRDRTCLTTEQTYLCVAAAPTASLQAKVHELCH